MATKKRTTPKTKETELSKAEKFYIEQNCNTLDLETICKDIGNDSLQVKAFLHDCIEKSKKEDTIDKLMIVDSKNGYAVMTRGASEKGEKNRRREPNKALSQHIHKIR